MTQNISDVCYPYLMQKRADKHSSRPHHYDSGDLVRTGRHSIISLLMSGEQMEKAVPVHCPRPACHLLGHCISQHTQCLLLPYRRNATKIIGRQLTLPTPATAKPKKHPQHKTSQGLPTFFSPFPVLFSLLPLPAPLSHTRLKQG